MNPIDPSYERMLLDESGELDEALERAALEADLAAHPALRGEQAWLQEITRASRRATPVPALDELTRERILAEARRHPPASHSTLHRLLAIAAAAVVLMGAGMLTLQIWTSGGDTPSTLAAVAPAVEQVELALLIEDSLLDQQFSEMEQWLDTRAPLSEDSLWNLDPNSIEALAEELLELEEVQL